MRLGSIERTPKEVVKIVESEMVLEADGNPKATGNLNTVRKLSDWVLEYAKNLQKAVDIKDIRKARLHIIEMNGAAAQMSEIIERIAKEMGLPDLDLK